MPWATVTLLRHPGPVVPWGVLESGTVYPYLPLQLTIAFLATLGRALAAERQLLGRLLSSQARILRDGLPRGWGDGYCFTGARPWMSNAAGPQS
jgi:hypothetical protein